MKTTNFFCVLAITAGLLAVSCSDDDELLEESITPEEEEQTETPAEEEENPEPEPDTYYATKVLNLTPNYITLGDVDTTPHEAGDSLEVEIFPGEVLTSGFNESLLEHVHLHVGSTVINPTVLDTEKLTIKYAVPAEDYEVIVAYAVQQQFTDDGYTMYLEDNDCVKLYGVSPDNKYKYFDCYFLTTDAYTIGSVEFKMGDSDWQNVEDVTGCSYSRSAYVDNVYRITIRPDRQNVTGDVILRVSGEQHGRYNITWVNAEEPYVDLEKSSFPSESIDGESVTATVYVNADYYLDGATADVEIDDLATQYRSYVVFTMPASDVTVTLDILEKITVTYVDSDNIAEGSIYDADDMFYGIETSKAIPGESVWVFALGEDGYKPLKANVSGSTTGFDFTYYGSDIFMSEVSIPEDATSAEISVEAVAAYRVTGGSYVYFNGGTLLAEGETCNVVVEVPDGQTLTKVVATAEDGTDISVTMDSPYASFTMPAQNVYVTAEFEDTDTSETITVTAEYDSTKYSVRSSTDYSWDFSSPFTMTAGQVFYLDVYSYYGDMFYVGVLIGETYTCYEATMDDMSGEYAFGKSLVADGDVTIKVGATEASVAIDVPSASTTVSVKAIYDSDQYRVRSSTNFDWDFASGFEVETGTTFYVTVQDDYGENFYVGIKIGDTFTSYAATQDEDTGEYTFGRSITADGDVTIKVGASESSVQID